MQYVRCDTRIINERRKLIRTSLILLCMCDIRINSSVAETKTSTLEGIDKYYPDNKVQGANTEPHVGPMNLAIREWLVPCVAAISATMELQNERTASTHEGGFNPLPPGRCGCDFKFVILSLF